MEISQSNALDYLSSRGLVQPEDVRQLELLGWGVSNTLVKVVTSNRCFVVKQSLPKLRVQVDWFAERERVYNEKDCIDVWRQLLGEGIVPEVLHEDRQNFLFIMSCAPPDGQVWKQELLNGEIDLDVARQVGEVLGRVHQRSHNDQTIRQRFLDDRCFIQLRIDPYHWTTAKVHPDVAEALRREADRMLKVKTVLVHGDYSPKNVIVYGAPRRVFLLDFEVVHYGNPVFDLAFCLNHLFLKSVHRPEIHEDYFRAVDAFWQGYSAEVHFVDREELEQDTVKQLGCLMLARIDGKSPVEYVKDSQVKKTVRSVAKKLLLEDYKCLADVKDLVREELRRLRELA